MYFYLALVSLSFYFFISYKTFKIVKANLKNYQKFNEICQLQQDHFYPFVRLDYPYWSKMQFYFCAIFLVPLRLLIIISCVLLCFTTVKLSLIGMNMNKPIVGPRKKLICFFASTFCRWILFGAGLYRIKVLKENIKDCLPNYENKSKENLPAPLIVCNHVSWVDTLCMISLFAPSFLAKEEVSHIPVVGFVAKALQALFVDRESRSDKDMIMKKIEQRSEMFKKIKGLPPLLIFPEGTNTNGKTMLHFKRGAFSKFECLQVICLEYEQKPFNLMIDDFGMGVDILMALCCFKHSLTVHVFESFNPAYLNLQKEDDWEKYASTIQEMMQNCLKAKGCNLGYRDSLEFTELLRENHIIQDRKMNVHNEFSPEKKQTKLSEKKNK